MTRTNHCADHLLTDRLGKLTNPLYLFTYFTSFKYLDAMEKLAFHFALSKMGL